MKLEKLNEKLGKIKEGLRVEVCGDASFPNYIIKIDDGRVVFIETRNSVFIENIANIEDLKTLNKVLKLSTKYFSKEIFKRRKDLKGLKVFTDKIEKLGLRVCLLCNHNVEKVECISIYRGKERIYKVSFVEGEYRVFFKGTEEDAKLTKTINKLVEKLNK